MSVFNNILFFRFVLLFVLAPLLVSSVNFPTVTQYATIIPHKDLVLKTNNAYITKHTDVSLYFLHMKDLFTLAAKVNKEIMKLNISIEHPCYKVLVEQSHTITEKTQLTF